MWVPPSSMVRRPVAPEGCHAKDDAMTERLNHAGPYILDRKPQKGEPETPAPDRDKAPGQAEAETPAEPREDD